MIDRERDSLQQICAAILRRWTCETQTSKRLSSLQTRTPYRSPSTPGQFYPPLPNHRKPRGQCTYDRASDLTYHRGSVGWRTPASFSKMTFLPLPSTPACPPPAARAQYLPALAGWLMPVFKNIFLL
jgi:hypothetical protein